ncbi:ATP-binding cassette domain-containing protein [Serpentinicella sp. ANB-PHB4]|uniref:ABC transporter ATP-binding protein n=1 Tax=Serpentinicella sp. ANB-PHB4 TaxID=3074076 RepID=UPI0028607678|nr:ATP-binding cassette domain-containing protein [Serpentinicella sp. ANB-PHB4]MDR5659814.1 ATP-binding cassette domain-containing protein [Serpentinicella sp. ANB-PHB4]
MIVLSCSNLSKSYGVDLILDQITFHINKGQKVGVIGPNGAGKSTLFKLLTGELVKDSGNIFISKSAQIGYLKQNHDFDEKKSIYEETVLVFSELIKLEKEIKACEQKIADLGKGNQDSDTLQSYMDTYAHLTEVFEQRNGYAFRSEVRGVLRGLGFSEELFSQPIEQLSGGQKTRISLAKLLLSKPDILLLDEPTNHLDIESVEWLEGFLKDYQGTVLIISHDRYFLDQTVTHVIEIENQKLLSFQGNYSDFIKKKVQLREQQRREQIALQKEMDRQKEIIRRFKQHGTEKLAMRAQSREKQLQKIKVPTNQIQTSTRKQFHFSSAYDSGTDVLAVNDLSKSFEDQPLFNHLSFNLYKGDKVGLIGPNGIGKSTLFKMILNESMEKIQLGHLVDLGYYDQELVNLKLDNNLVEEIADAYPHMNETDIRTLLGSFLFFNDDVFKQIKTLSGGEKARVSLLKLILSESNFLLLDEPTNHLDIASKEILEIALCEYDGTIFVISHDRYFLDRVTNKIIELSPNKAETFLGNYSYYIEKKKEQAFLLEADSVPEKQTKTHQKEIRRKEKEAKAKARQQEKEQQEIEEKIIQLESKLEDLKSSMCDEKIYSDPEKSKSVNEEFQFVESEIEKLYEVWESMQ